MNYWLMKSEPDVFGIEHLQQRPNQTEPWDGVRNYQARNMMRDQMQEGDLAFFYHSNCKVPGIVGVMEIVRAGYPDPTQFDPETKYYDPKSNPDKPRWYLVDVKFKQTFKRTISLTELKEHPELEDMPLVRKGNRLSIMPVTAEQWAFIVGLE
ncbi:EVE domain-containing protein [Alkalilimnicola ehrlichii]|uniref:EVE domain-containing protein n=1 Tax=Alkalilimnicola ehrlichii TaxID=351052 RepID=A0A3E0X1I5_9GAMM|nr:EVE domain-containing protein [Alkalilimnicola ehrlichii]RFA31252.1 EVE domain-containing protein [Alkalilimnicola ehrlichii]RFA39471.1 EVE domain-containing protein [Alkalilimnicola ehrlichii]